MMYLMPKLLGDDSAEAITIISKSGVPFVSAENLRDLVAADLEHALVIVQINEPTAFVLNRTMSELMLEVPVLVRAVPGAAYTPDLLGHLRSIPHTTWNELAVRLAKSGLTTTDPSKTAERSNPRLGVGASPLGSYDPEKLQAGKTSAIIDRVDPKSISRRDNMLNEQLDSFVADDMAGEE